MMNGMLGLIILSAALTAQPVEDLMTPEEALVLGRKVPEVEALYGLEGGRWASCVESKAVRSCDSDWVTCVDDGWVVSYSFGPQCGISHDGRLSVTLLINAKTGQVISRFPEQEYFTIDAFCRDDHDCLPVDGALPQEPLCRNFIYAQLSGAVSEGNCRCVAHSCAADQ